MLIAIDYDNTYTADPEWWDEVIRSGQERGHTIVCHRQNRTAEITNTGDLRR